MPIVIGSNIPSLGAQRKLKEGADALSSSSERLSSGLRINRAADDAAGLSIASSLNADSRIFTQAVRNVNDGISLLNIADGALGELSNISVRQKELAEQAANGVYTLQQRKAMNAEANALVNEFNRIIQTTSFNGLKVLDAGTSSDTNIQAGYGASSTLTVSTTSQLSRTVGAGGFLSETQVTNPGGNPGAKNLVADFDRDGKIDIFGTEGRFYAGNGNGTFKAAVLYQGGSGSGGFGDFNNDGSLDVITRSNVTTANITLGNGDGTFKAAVTYTAGTSLRRITVGDFNGDGNLDFAGANNVESTFSVVLGNGNGTFKNQTAYSINDSNAPWGIISGDLNSDGAIDIVTGASNGRVSVALGNGDGTFRIATTYDTGGGAGADDVQLGDLDGDGILDLVTANYNAPGSFSVMIGNGNGSFRVAVTYSGPTKNESVAIGDFNNDGILDVASGNAFGATHTLGLALGNGDGTFRATSTFGTSHDPYGIDSGDFNGDGVLDLTSSNFNGGSAFISVFLQNTTSVTTAARLDLLSQSSARTTLETVSSTLNRINLQRGSLGAFQSRLVVANSNLMSTIENYRSAASRIADTDIAQESAELVRRRILVQAGASVLAQANQAPALALTLLRGG